MDPYAQIPLGSIEDSLHTYHGLGGYLHGFGLPLPVIKALESLRTSRGFSSRELHSVMRLLEGVCRSDSGAADLDARLLFKSVFLGWPFLAGVTSDFSWWLSSAVAESLAVQDALGTAKAEAKESGLHSNRGMAGFQELAHADDWDLALGKLTGYRKMSLFSSDGGSVLLGAYSRPFDTAARTDDGRSVATCSVEGKYHQEVPADEPCGCGWWAYWDADEAASHFSVNEGTPVVVAVEGSGRTIVGERGWRSEFLRITGIAPWAGAASSYGYATSASNYRRVRDYLDGSAMPGATAYEHVGELAKDVGKDPVYGSLSARYPEYSSYSADDLRAYEAFLRAMHSRAETQLRELALAPPIGISWQVSVTLSSPPPMFDTCMQGHQRLIAVAHELTTARILVSSILKEKTEGGD